MYMVSVCEWLMLHLFLPLPHTHIYSLIFAGDHNYIVHSVNLTIGPQSPRMETQLHWLPHGHWLIVHSFNPSALNGDVIWCDVSKRSDMHNGPIFQEQWKKWHNYWSPGGVDLWNDGRGREALPPPTFTRQVEFDHLWEISIPHALEHSGEDVCIYTGAGNFSHDSIGTVRAKHPINLLSSEEQRSFEVWIIQPEVHKYIGSILVWDLYAKPIQAAWLERDISRR